MPEQRWPWATASEIADDIRANLAADDEFHALRMLVDGINRLPEAQKAGRLDEALEEPRTTGDARWDALLAAAILYQLHQMGESGPHWTVKEPLEKFWWPIQAGAGRANYDLATAPAELARLGIFLSERDFTAA